MKKMFLRLVIASSVSLFAVSTVKSASAEITIATAGPMTGQYAAFGEQMQMGAEAAVRDINAAGGVLGQELRLEVGDDACDPRQAVSVARQLVNDGAIFVAGHFCSGSSIPASSVYSDEGILQISPASTNPALTDDGDDNVFRVCGRDDQQGSIAGNYLAEEFGDGNIAILHDKSSYGKGLADETREALNAAGVQETLYEAYTAGESDYSALVSRLKAENIDAVYIGGYHTEAGLILRQMREQGVEVQMLAGDALVTDEFWGITGDVGNGVLMTFGPDPRAYPEALEVVERFREEGYEPEGYTLYTYAAVQVFVQAAEIAGSTELDALIEALQNNSFDTVIGSLSFDENGDIEQTAYVWYQWQDGQYTQLDQ